MNSQQAAEYGRLLRAKRQEWFKVAETSTMLDAIRHFAIALRQADVALPSIVMDSEDDWSKASLNEAPNGGPVRFSEIKQYRGNPLPELKLSQLQALTFYVAIESKRAPKPS